MSKKNSSRRVKISCLALALTSVLSFNSQAQATDTNVIEKQRHKVAKNYQKLKAKIEKEKKISVIAKAASGSRAGRHQLGMAAAGGALQSVGVKPKKTFDRWGLMELEVDSKELDALIDSGQFEIVRENAEYELQLAESAQHVNAITAHSSGFIGYGTAVAVIDSGIDTDHSFFGGRIVEEACFTTHNPSNGDYSTCPNGLSEQTGPGANLPCNEVYPYKALFQGWNGGVCQHGSSVAGVVAGFNSANGDRGMAPGANLVAINVITRRLCPDGINDVCSTIYEADLIRSLEWILDNAADLDIAAVNLSMSIKNDNKQACDDHIIAPAIDDLTEQGIAVIVASGNSGSSDSIGAPACVTSAIAVGATGDNTDSIPSFSNSSALLDMLAPGYNITSASPGGGFQSNNGTSFASPHVAGAFAVLRAAVGANADVGYLRQVMAAYGDPVLDFRNSIITPRLDVYAAIENIVSSSCSNTPAKPSAPAVSAISGTTVSASWTGSSSAELYTVQIWDFSSSKWTDRGSTRDTSMFITGLGSGPQYIRVRSVNRCGESGYNGFSYVAL